MDLEIDKINSLAPVKEPKILKPHRNEGPNEYWNRQASNNLHYILQLNNNCIKKMNSGETPTPMEAHAFKLIADKTVKSLKPAKMDAKETSLPTGKKAKEYARKLREHQTLLTEDAEIINKEFELEEDEDKDTLNQLGKI